MRRFSRAMQLVVRMACAAALLPAAARAQLGYQFDITTAYGFANPFVNFVGGGAPSPDTGFWQVVNNGLTSFAGTIGFTAVSNFCGDQSFSAPGSTVPEPGSVVLLSSGLGLLGLTGWRRRRSA